MTGEDTPLEVIPDSGCYVGQIVDLAEFKIRHGRSPYKAKPCRHSNLIYSESERRVWCEDCSRTIDNFDAFMIFTSHFEKMLREVNHRRRTADDALKHTARLRATKTLDRMWAGRRMAPCCPHCHGGLLPQDFANGAAAGVSFELEEARRKAGALERN